MKRRIKHNTIVLCGCEFECEYKYTPFIVLKMSSLSKDEIDVVSYQKIKYDHSLQLQMPNLDGEYVHDTFFVSSSLKVVGHLAS